MAIEANKSIPFIYSTEFDFKPVNPELLLLSRLDFMTKHQKVRNFHTKTNIFVDSFIFNISVQKTYIWDPVCEGRLQSQARNLEVEFGIWEGIGS